MKIVKAMIYLLSIIFIVLFIMSFFVKKSVKSEITIDVNHPSKVWDVLLDTKKYPEWNPVFQLIEGEIAEGNKVVYQFTESEEIEHNNDIMVNGRNTKNEIEKKIVKKYNISTKVFKVEKNRLLNQKGGMPFILTFNHKYIFDIEKRKSIGGGTSITCTIEEEYKGFAVLFWSPKSVLKAYERLNQALKDRVEKLNILKKTN